jgi:phospholipid/cholesterol/gamma-HCH transport system ATP-binding protein
MYKIADRISMLYKGKITFSGTPEEVKHAKNEYVKQFLHAQTSNKQL